MASVRTSFLLALLLSTAAFAKEVVILCTNDLHAHAVPYQVPFVDSVRKVGGFANIAAFVKQEKRAHKAAFFLDAGDYFTGPHLSSLTNGVLQASRGLRVRYDSRRPAGQRVLSMTLDGKPLEEGATYRVVTSSFLVDGGDGYQTFLAGRNRQNRSGYYISDAVVDHLRSTRSKASLGEDRVAEAGR